MQTPSRRRDSTSGTTSAEASPDAVSGTLHFPAGLSSKTVRVLDRRLILLTEEGDWELLERCRALNPSVWKDFFLLGRRLYFEDRLANESRIHEAIVESIRQSAERHSSNLVSRSGLSNARLVVGNVDLRPTGVPDVAIVSRQSMYTIDPVIVVEVAYTVSLSTTLDKVRQHFTSIPHLRAAIVVDIHHPWNRLPADAHGHAYYDVGNGKMVFFYFLRGHGGEVMTLGRVVSFGNIAIDADDVARIVDLTGADPLDIVGAVAGRQYEPCNAVGLYTVAIENDIIYYAPAEPGENLAVVNPFLHQIDEAVQNGEQPGPLPELVIDLFDLKENAYDRGSFS